MNGRGCCCVWCTLTTVTLTTRASVPYTLACGTDKRWGDGTGFNWNLNQPAGPIVLSRALEITHPGICTNKHMWVTAIANRLPGPTGMPNRCTPPVGFQPWNYYAAASITIKRNNNPSGNIWTCVLAQFHMWTMFGQFDNPGAHLVQYSSKLDVPTPSCPTGTYPSAIATFTQCDLQVRGTGYGPTAPNGASGMQLTWGVAGGSSVVS
jgi:hypothetical protein